MKTKMKISVALSISVIVSSALASSSKIAIVNNYTLISSNGMSSLQFTADQSSAVLKNPSDQHFNLTDQAQQHIELNTSKPTEVYFTAYDTKSTVHTDAFFGISINPNHSVSFHGYCDTGIAYSWDHNHIYFCTPSYYAQNNGSCKA